MLVLARLKPPRCERHRIVRSIPCGFLLYLGVALTFNKHLQLVGIFPLARCQGLLLCRFCISVTAKREEMVEFCSRLRTRSREGKTPPAPTYIGRRSLRQRRDMSLATRVPQAREAAVACEANERLLRGIAVSGSAARYAGRKILSWTRIDGERMHF